MTTTRDPHALRFTTSTSRPVAKMVPFAGYEMPIQSRRHHGGAHAVRSAAGLFDASHMGEFEIRGSPGARSRPVRHHERPRFHPRDRPGAVLDTSRRDDGTLLDDLIVYRISPTTTSCSWSTHRTARRISSGSRTSRPASRRPSPIVPTIWPPWRCRDRTPRGCSNP